MNATLETIGRLRTIHGDFTSDSIPEEDLNTILEAGFRAANASNRQSYSIVVVRDRQKMKELTGYEGAVTLVYCVDFNRLQDMAQRLGHTQELRGIQALITGCVDTSLVAQTSVIAARSLGIDSLLTNGIHRGELDRVYRILDLPRTLCFPLVALVLGRPNHEPEHLRGRLTGPGVIHEESYQHATTEQIDQIIERFDDPESRLGAGVPWKEKGFPHFLDWFFGVWSTRAPRHEGRSPMVKELAARGFLDGELGSAGPETNP